MKKLLKKMAYDREKHEKQEKTTNEVRKSGRSIVNCDLSNFIAWLSHSYWALVVVTSERYQFLFF